MAIFDVTAFDVTVRGAGVFGLSVAFACAKRGARVQVIDPNGVAVGASGGIVGALAPHVPENWNPKKAFQLSSLLMAENFWSDVAETGGGAPGYGRLGRLQPIADEHQLALARGRAEGARALWQDNASWEVVRAEDLGAWVPPSPTGWVIRDTLSARLHPRKATQALAAAVLALGGEISNEGLDQGAVVWASGVAGLSALSEDLGKPLGNGVKGQALLLDLDLGQAPQLFAETLHFVPHVDGTLAVGSTSERTYEVADEVDAALDALWEKAREVLPAVRDAQILERWAGVRPRARSRAPMLGVWPGRRGHYVANGGFKIGFGMAPKVAEVMADLVLEGRDRITDGFRVEDSF
ncbi:MAG: FAD-binding oxidoreductase [Pseudomonadota bacterium]